MERYCRFTAIIAGINRCIHKIKDNEMSEFGLKGTNVTSLYYLYVASAPITAKDLADLSGEDKGAISRSVVELEKFGYITSNFIGEKKYRTALSLTDKGVKIAKIISDKISSILNEVNLDITEKDRDSMYATLDEIYSKLLKICDAYSAN